MTKATQPYGDVALVRINEEYFDAIKFAIAIGVARYSLKDNHLKFIVVVKDVLKT